MSTPDDPTSLGERVSAPAPPNSVCAQCERAFQMLAMHGVPRERARTVANGIDVLVMRLERTNDALREALGDPPGDVQERVLRKLGLWPPPPPNCGREGGENG